MAKPQTIRFNGSKVLIQKAEVGASVNITAMTATKPATLTVEGFTGKKGDVINVTGLDGFEGGYVVQSFAENIITLAGTDWTDKAAATEFTTAKAELLQFTSSNFCELKNFQKSGSTTDQVDVSTICSVDGKDYESGDREEGDLQLQFFLKPDSDAQQLLEDYEFSGDKFWVTLVLPAKKGLYLFYGSISSGMSLDGQVGGRWDSGVTIKLSGRRYYVSAN